MHNTLVALCRHSTLGIAWYRNSTLAVPAHGKPLHVAQGDDDGAQHHRGTAVGGQPWGDGDHESSHRRPMPTQVLRVQLLLTRGPAQGTPPNANSGTSFFWGHFLKKVSKFQRSSEKVSCDEFFAAVAPFSQFV